MLHVVTKNTKNKSWKQITTIGFGAGMALLLLPKIQRTKVESKSQQVLSKWCLEGGCYQKYKEQKLKANHNFTAASSCITALLPKIQRTKVESKSQPYPRYAAWHTRCYQKYKEQKLKANHNGNSEAANNLRVVTKNTKNKSWKQITT